MNYEVVTIEDCLENYYMKDKAVIITAGQVIGFIKEY